MAGPDSAGHRNPLQAQITRLAREPRRPSPLPPMRPDPGPAGPHAVQVLRTYPSKHPPFPFAPAGLGDGARVFARTLRLGLWREHLGRGPGEDDDLLDPATGVAAWREAAEQLAAWHRGGRRGPRQPGRALPHATESVPWWAAWWAAPAYLLLVDPDGRPLRLRLARRL